MRLNCCQKRFLLQLNNLSNFITKRYWYIFELFVMNYLKADIRQLTYRYLAPKFYYCEIWAFKHRFLIEVRVNDCTLHRIHLLSDIIYCAIVDTNKRMQIMACCSLHQKCSLYWKSCATTVKLDPMRRSQNEGFGDECSFTVGIES
uniref:Chymotrypsin-like elastase family member 1 n=1 Tax=Schistocephalus solidus TaxID=70667 RepID=A0A0X3NVB5_SCHSO